ncbi:hypothetical protein GNI_207500 [Gregarina niphandrodes]|uniref:Uncharacterized protein n=1 Tax=Gregarina niphandrodes TaxID=110365 RepID=A0A023AXE6_GRENI|nr:hypothetical protein GNI_207500 [Gregarina niphandrodes]EZG42920.1 hypothetical protein GNI_207500 [Gregarina niphandrodes]|eukprot:XP_011133804.1 hypothetical protein GNI_207500 [Gregarina niphandrodes]
MRTMNYLLVALSREDPSSWAKYVSGLMLAYNASANEATGSSPFEMNTEAAAGVDNNDQGCGTGC